MKGVACRSNALNGRRVINLVLQDQLEAMSIIEKVKCLKSTPESSIAAPCLSSDFREPTCKVRPALRAYEACIKI